MEAGTTRWWLRPVGVTLGRCVLVSGCTESVEEASDNYCSSLESLDSAVVDLRALVAGDATVEEVHDQKTAIQDAYQQTVDAASDLDEAVSNESERAYDSFQDAVDAIPVSEAAAQYTAAAEAYLALLANIAVEAGCEPSPS